MIASSLSSYMIITIESNLSSKLNKNSYIHKLVFLLFPIRAFQQKIARDETAQKVVNVLYKQSLWEKKYFPFKN
jgi:hypothetical protein